MVVNSLAEALEQEHQEIDGGIELFLVKPSSDGAQAEQLLRVITALRRHIYLEEEFVFPRLKAMGTFAAVLVMLREHGEIWRTLDSMESELAAGDGPADELRAFLATGTMPEGWTCAQAA